MGSREDERDRTHQGQDWTGFLLVARGREQLSPALHLGLFMKHMSHSEQCHTPGLGRPSDVQVQGVPPPCGVALATGLLHLGFLGTGASGSPTSWAPLERVGVGVENLN